MQDAFDESLGERKWQDFEIPEANQIGSVWRSYVARKAKMDQWRKQKTPQEVSLGTAVLKCVQSAQCFRSQSDQELAASEIVHRYTEMRDRRPFQCWDTRCLTALPISAKERWPMDTQRRLVESLKDIDPNETSSEFQVATITAHPSKQREVNDRRRAMVEIAEEDPDANDIDDRDWDDDLVRNSYPCMDFDHVKLSSQNSRLIDAHYELIYTDFHRLHEVRKEMQRIGNTFRDDKKYYKVDRVVVHSNDKEKWLFFEYYPVTYLSQYDKAPPYGHESRENTRCCIFEGGKHYFGNAEPGWFVWEEVLEGYDGTNYDELTQNREQ